MKYFPFFFFQNLFGTSWFRNANNILKKISLVISLINISSPLTGKASNPNCYLYFSLSFFFLMAKMKKKEKRRYEKKKIDSGKNENFHNVNSWELKSRLENIYNVIYSIHSFRFQLKFPHFREFHSMYNRYSRTNFILSIFFIMQGLFWLYRFKIEIRRFL